MSKAGKTVCGAKSSVQVPDLWTELKALHIVITLISLLSSACPNLLRAMEDGVCLNLRQEHVCLTFACCCYLVW